MRFPDPRFSRGLHTFSIARGLRYDSILLFFVCTVSVAPMPAGAQASIAGARGAALTGDPAGSVADPWSESNPAGWSDLPTHVLVVHAARLYGLSELDVGSVQAVARLGGTSAALGARTFGYEAYTETILTAGLATGLRTGSYRPFYVGLRVRHHRLSIRNYGAASATALSSGFVFPILSNVNLGMAAENVVVLKSPISDDLPRRLHAGLSFVGADVLHVHADVVKGVRSPLTSRISVETRPWPGVTVRSGFSLVPPRFAGGIGIDLARLTLDVAAERHLVLGWSPSCSAGLRW